VRGEGEDAYRTVGKFVGFDGIRFGDAGGFAGASRRFDYDCAAGAAGLRAANLPWAGIFVDAWLLGLRRPRRWLLLGAGNLGGGAFAWASLDAWLLGLEQWRLCFQ
jgi:hypothetical protein